MREGSRQKGLFSREETIETARMRMTKKVFLEARRPLEKGYRGALSSLFSENLNGLVYDGGNTYIHALITQPPFAIFWADDRAEDVRKGDRDVQGSKGPFTFGQRARKKTDRQVSICSTFFFFVVLVDIERFSLVQPCFFALFLSNLHFSAFIQSGRKAIKSRSVPFTCQINRHNKGSLCLLLPCFFFSSCRRSSMSSGFQSCQSKEALERASGPNLDFSLFEFKKHINTVEKARGKV